MWFLTAYLTSSAELLTELRAKSPHMLSMSRWGDWVSPIPESEESASLAR